MTRSLSDSGEHSAEAISRRAIRSAQLSCIRLDCYLKSDLKASFARNRRQRPSSQFACTGVCTGNCTGDTHIQCLRLEYVCPHMNRLPPPIGIVPIGILQAPPNQTRKQGTCGESETFVSLIKGLRGIRNMCVPRIRHWKKKPCREAGAWFLFDTLVLAG